MKNQLRKKGVKPPPPKRREQRSPPFDELLESVLSSEEFYGRFPARGEFERWIRTTATECNEILRELYERHGVPPDVPLETLALSAYFGLGPRNELTPRLLRNRSIQEKTARALEDLATDLESVSIFFLAPSLRSTPEFHRQLRQYATAIRSLDLYSGRPAHRPPDVVFGFCASMLTQDFRKHSGRPLWNYTGELLQKVLKPPVIQNPGDRVKKMVKREEKEQLKAKK